MIRVLVGRRLAAVVVLAMLCALGLWSTVHADPPVGGAAGPGPAHRPPAPPAARFRDPTQPSPEMRSAIEAEQFVPKPGDNAPAAPTLPQVTLKARLIGSRGQPTAVIDVNGKTFTVHPESEVVGASTGASTVVVREISEQGVLVEVLPLKKSMLIN